MLNVQNMHSMLKSNQTYTTKPSKPNLPNQTFPTKPSQPNLPNQTYQTKAISDICHERHEYIHVKFFWPV